MSAFNFASTPATDRIKALLSTLHKQVAAIRGEDAGAVDEARKVALRAAKEVVAELEKPEEVIMWYSNVVSTFLCNQLLAGADNR